MNRARCALAALASAGLGLACSTLAARAPEVSSAVVAAGLAQGDDRATLERGRAVFGKSCARCHALPHVADQTPEQWPDVLAEMSRKARLDRSSSRSVAAYIRALIVSGADRRE